MVRANGRKLTAKQAAVLRYLVSHFGERQAYPTLRQVADHFGWSGPNATVCHLKLLLRKGVLEADVNADGQPDLGAYRVTGLSHGVRAVAEVFLNSREVVS